MEVAKYFLQSHQMTHDLTRKFDSNLARVDECFRNQFFWDNY